jgi:MOSC domain-containing protein YiiM
LHPRVTHLFLKVETHKAMEFKETVNLVADKGIVGDAAYGRRKRQILLVSKDVLLEFNLQPGEIRENIVVEGVPIDSLPPDTVLQLGSTNIKLVGPCTPCARLDKIRPGLQELLHGKRGVLAQAIADGEIAIGDDVTILLP